jgi:hypothetical protein
VALGVEADLVPNALHAYDLDRGFFGLKFRRHRVRLEKFLAGHRMHGTVCETFIEALLKWKGVCKQSKFAKEVDRKIFIWITGVCHSLIARVVLGTPFYAILRHSH